MAWCGTVRLGWEGYGEVWFGEDMGNIFQRNKRELLKDRCLQHLGGKKCFICGIDHLPISAYDFHHYKGLKKYNISEMIAKNTPWKLIKEELNKCRILCANHHRMATNGYINLKELW